MSNRVGSYVCSTEDRTLQSSAPILIDGLAAEPRKRLVEDIARLIIANRGQFHRVLELTEPEIDLLDDVLDEWDQTDLRRYLNEYLTNVRREIAIASTSVVI